MKKQLVLAAALLCAASAAKAQDVIVKRNARAEEIPAKVLEVGDEQIRYRKFSNPDGPVYTINRSEVFFIRYENGEKEVITTYDTPSVPQNSADTLADIGSGRALRETRPLRSRSWQIGVTPTLGMAAVFFKEDNWSGPAVSVGIDGNYYFSEYATECIGASLNFLYSSIGDDVLCDLSMMNLDLYYGAAGSPSGSSIGYKIGLSLGFPLSLQMDDYDLSDSLNGCLIGSFAQLGWSWRHNDVGLRLQYYLSNLIKKVDSSMFCIGVYYSYRF